MAHEWFCKCGRRSPLGLSAGTNQHRHNRIQTAELNPIEIVVDIDLQQDRWVVSPTTSCSRIDTLKPECPKVSSSTKTSTIRTEFSSAT